MIDWTRLQPPETRAAEARASLHDEIRRHRDRAVEAGVEINGLRLATDDLSQQRLTGAALGAVIDPASRVQWKTATGFVSLDAPMLLQAAQAVRAHVQACFDHEAQLLSVLEAGGQPDPGAGWPG